MPPLLEVQNLVVDYLTPSRVVRAVDSISFDVQPGEIVGQAGESGCGKSTTAHAILRLLRPPADISGGRILVHGDDILALDDKSLRAFRWRNVSIVFQSAMNSLNPVISVADQFLDTFQAHEKISKKAAMARAEELMGLVGIDKSRLKRAVVGRLGDRVKRWITVNEPWVASWVGYGEGRHAPGKKDGLQGAIKAAHYLMLAHGSAVKTIRDIAPTSRVGISLNLAPAYPASSSPADGRAALLADVVANRWFLDPVFLGRYPNDIPQYLEHLPENALSDLPAISTP